jgi:hypothetical protein
MRLSSQKRTKIFPEVCVQDQIFVIFCSKSGLTISRGSWRLSAFGATTRAAAKIIRENDE